MAKAFRRGPAQTMPSPAKVMCGWQKFLSPVKASGDGKARLKKVRFDLSIWYNSRLTNTTRFTGGLMKNFYARTVLSIFFSLLLTSQTFAFSVSYDQTVSIDAKPMAVIKVMVQDEKMRAESDFGGMKSILLRNETGSYSYMPEQKMATKIPAAMDKPNLTRDLPHFMDFLTKNNGQKIGAEKIGGKDCDIYRFTEPMVQQESKAWVWTEKQFPVKIEVPAPEGLTLVELSNIQFDPAVDPSLFQLPGDVKVIDFEAQQQAASAPANASKDTGVASTVS